MYVQRSQHHHGRRRQRYDGPSVLSQMVAAKCPRSAFPGSTCQACAHLPGYTSSIGTCVLGRRSDRHQVGAGKDDAVQPRSAGNATLHMDSSREVAAIKPLRDSMILMVYPACLRGCLVFLAYQARYLLSFFWPPSSLIFAARYLMLLCTACV